MKLTQYGRSWLAGERLTIHRKLKLNPVRMLAAQLAKKARLSESEIAALIQDVVDQAVREALETERAAILQRTIKPFAQHHED